MSEQVASSQQGIDVTTDVYLCRPPRAILHEDGSISTVVAETINDQHESIPVALMRTEHGYDGVAFNNRFVPGTCYKPATRVSAVVLGKSSREAIIPQDPKRTYEKRIRKAQKEMGQTLLATMRLTD